MVSHEAQNNAQREVVGDAGKVFLQDDVVGYATEMFRLKNNPNYYDRLSKIALDRYTKYYSFDSNFGNLIDLISRGLQYKY
jgi:glycosyltransferase involved in cell wall biosynthesis